LPNAGPYIYDVSISGFTRSSIYIYDISSLRVKRVPPGGMEIEEERKDMAATQHKYTLLLSGQE